jgi:hypothetical protein
MQKDAQIEILLKKHERLVSLYIHEDKIDGFHTQMGSEPYPSSRKFEVFTAKNLCSELPVPEPESILEP